MLIECLKHGKTEGIETSNYNVYCKKCWEEGINSFKIPKEFFEETSINYPYSISGRRMDNGTK